VGSTDRLEIYGRIFAAPVDFEFKRQPIALVESRNAGTFDGGDVHERVGLAVIALDESEALHRIEELDRAFSLFAGQLSLRAAVSASRAAAAAIDRHRLAFDSKVRRRDPPAAIDQRELERLPVGEVRQTRLLDRRNVNENVVSAIIANDEAESLLRVEELHDALAFADDLRGHSATAAETAASASAETTAVATAVAPATVAAEPAAIAVRPLTESAALSKPATIAGAFFEEPVALVSATTAAVAFTPSIETHAR
jgi:hypothetical protein